MGALFTCFQHRDCLQMAMNQEILTHIHYGHYICPACAGIHLKEFKDMAPRDVRVIIQNEVVNREFFEPVIIIATKITHCIFRANFWIYGSDLSDVKSIKVDGRIIISPANGKIDAGISCQEGYLNVTFHAVPEARIMWRDDPTPLTIGEYLQKWAEHSTIASDATFEISKEVGTIYVD